MGGKRPKGSESPERGTGDKSAKRKRSRGRSRSRSRSRRSASSSSSASDSGSSGSGSSSDSRDRRRHKHSSKRSHKSSKASRKDKDREAKAREKEERRAARKATKLAAKRAQRKVKDSGDKVAAALGYSNDSNPFGDSNLSEQFVWGKKYQRELAERKIAAVPTAHEAAKAREANIDELLKVRARRDQYEREREEKDAKRMEDQRQREAELFGDWQEKEEEFHRIQAKRRSALRIRDGREKPIDILAKNILMLQAGNNDGTLASAIAGDNVIDDALMEFELTEPYRILEGLPVSELTDLLKDIRMYLDMEKSSEFREYWSCLAALCVQEIRAAEEEASASQAGGSEGRRIRQLHVSVAKDVAGMFEGKGAKELEGMRGRIEDAARGRGSGSGGPRGDADYWQGVLTAFNVYAARAKLKDIHMAVLEQSLRKLDERKAELRRARLAAAAATGEHGVSVAARDADADDGSDLEDGVYSPQVLAAADSDDERAVSPTLALDSGASASGAPSGSAVDASDDIKRLEAKRAAIIAAQRRAATGQSLVDEDVVARRREAFVSGGKGGADGETVDSRLLQQLEAERAFGGVGAAEEELLGDESLPAEAYAWQDKYRPRKPRYFNRVKTGYDWNKYNQTHYDHDNPPPKTVQGYKFNIFYPDLIDKSVTPKYYLEPADSPEFCIIRFHAGPPYEDIAFKIVNKEWNYERKHGYKCQYDRGILQLYFNFKRHLYRR